MPAFTKPCRRPVGPASIPTLAAISRPVSRRKEQRNEIASRVLPLPRGIISDVGDFAPSLLECFRADAREYRPGSCQHAADGAYQCDLLRVLFGGRYDEPRTR